LDGVNSGGGSGTLARLIDDYGEYLAADLLETYGIDIRDLLVPGSGVTPRWLLVQIKNLPITSRFYSEKRGGQQFRGWDESRYAIVAVVNAVRALQFTYVAAHSKQKPKPPAPFPVPDSSVRKQSSQRPGSFAFIAKAQLAAAKRRKQVTG
jgi:hypothetical protein